MPHVSSIVPACDRGIKTREQPRERSAGHPRRGCSLVARVAIVLEEESAEGHPITWLGAPHRSVRAERPFLPPTH